MSSTRNRANPLLWVGVVALLACGESGGPGEPGPAPGAKAPPTAKNGPAPETKPAPEVRVPNPDVNRAPAPEPPSTYKLPPDDVVKIVDAAPTPATSVDPTGRRMAVIAYPALPPIELLAEPMHRQAGTRLNPDRNERRRTRYFTAIEIQDLENGDKRTAVLPKGANVAEWAWSPDGEQLAFTLSTAVGVELWVLPANAREPRKLTEAVLNDTLDGPFSWMPGSKGLLVHTVPRNRSYAPERPRRPAGPVAEETTGRRAQNRTYQDLLTDAHDDALFEHFFSRELAVVDLAGKMRRLPGVGIFAAATPSPDGTSLLVERLEAPYSRQVPWYRFGHKVEVWSIDGTTEPRVLHEAPAADEVPIGGVPKGPRNHRWEAHQPATVMWVEALDDGDPKKKVPHRDRIMRLSSPHDGEAAEVTKTEQRLSGIDFLETAGQFILREYDRDRRWVHAELRSVDGTGTPSVLEDRSTHDRYGDPGSPVRKRLPNGQWVVRVDDGAMYRRGAGASPEGDRPFLHRVPLPKAGEEAGAPEELFRSPEGAYATVTAIAADGRYVLRKETPEDPPNVFLQKGDEAPKQITEFPHPHPQLSDVHKELLTYRRRDGVPLSGTLYLPPGHDGKTPLPLVIWAYPREYTDKKVAGQVRAAPTRFTRLSGTSPLMFLTQGYAVLNNAAMPVVGDPETMNDKLLPQLRDSAKAAIDAVDRLGVADRDRVGVAGHSYGAFMTANLLAHTDLFQAGIARSGAFNRSLTPFGFQSERRTLWEATDAYVAVSPLFHAEKINEPLLMIHGEIDNNSGTFPIQSRRLYHAMSGLGGTARLVVLPEEAHGYRARESVLHVLAESFEWFDRYVKGEPEATPAEQPAQP